jgi:hypothetical protein
LQILQKKKLNKQRMQKFTKLQIVGENEGVRDPDFIFRGNCHFESLSYDNYCPMNATDWSELKTSLAVNELLNDPYIYQSLSVFIQEINQKLIAALNYFNNPSYQPFDEFVDNSNFNSVHISNEIDKLKSTIFNLRSELQSAGEQEDYNEISHKTFRYMILFSRTKEEEYKLSIYEKQKRVHDLEQEVKQLESKLNDYTNALNYPISQYQGIDPYTFRDDFYVQFHYTKYITEQKMRYTITSETITSSTEFQVMLILELRQKINELMGLVRGPRSNKYKNQKVSKQVGITRVKFDRLDRKIRPRKRTRYSDYENVEILPWAHPGKAQCYVPYRGGYGRFLKQNKDTYYGSRQCGISGSTQFLSFAFLMSLMHESLDYLQANARKADYVRFFNELCQSAFLILVGDGGHNFVEVLYGIMFSLLFLRKLIIFCQTNKDYSIVDQMLSVNTDLHIPRIELIAEAFRKIMPFLNYVYERTSNINFMHINEEHDLLDIENYKKTFQGFTKEYFETLFSGKTEEDDDNIMVHLQFMFAFDPIAQKSPDERPRYRYEINDDENNSNLQLLIQSIISNKYNQLIVGDLQRVKRNCDVNVEKIPFAMKRNKSKVKYLG